MKDLTHYFTDSLKSAETPSTVSKEVINDVKEKSTKSDSAPKKRGRKKNKSISTKSNDSKKSKCELDVEIIKFPAKRVNGFEDDGEEDHVQDTMATSCVQDNQEKIRAQGSAESSQEDVNKPLDNLESNEINDTIEPRQNGQETNDFVQNNKNKCCIIENEKGDENNVDNGTSEVEENGIIEDDKELDNINNETSQIEENGIIVDNKEHEKNVNNGTSQDEKSENSTDLSLETMESEASEIQEKKKKRKEKVKALADKKGLAKRKQMEDKETEEMEKTLKSRKNVFTNVPKRDENQPEIVHKPPAYSLLNYFSKSTPEQRLREEAAKCKISVKADVHSPKDDVSSTPPNSTPTSRPKNSQKKKKKAETKRTLSQVDEIQFIRSESISPQPVPQEKKKINKPKWRVKFHSDNFSDHGTDSETSSPKQKLKTQNERKSEEVNGKASVLKAIENATKIENSDTESTPRRSIRCKTRKKTKDISDTDECIELDKETKVSADKEKTIDSKLNDNDESRDSDITIVKEIEPKRLAPEKIAPLFIKKRKLDPAVLEARRIFLQSDMVENEDRSTKRKPSPVRNSVLPFPKITHITQLDTENHCENHEIKLQLKSSSEYSLALDASKFSSVTKMNYLHVERCLTTFDSTKLNVDIESSLCEIETRCTDARTMWQSISSIKKGENPKKTPKVRTSKRRSSGKKVVNTEEEVIVDNVWTHKYKPRRIDQVVGNEQSAAKLKDWLEKWKAPSRRDNDDSDNDFYSSDCSSISSGDGYNQVAILIGPYGCGKTASVYAAAEELGYSVLEINASSRRTGKKILKELEEATKSHRIKKSDMKQTFLKMKIEEKTIPQNSLIFMEDVNIIFEEDDGFISAAYQLASNTKRPIVMTCSDTCSHLNKLAPQQILIKFHAAAGDRVSALLELISLAETGRKLSLSCVESLLSSGDLRKALLQLQYLLASGDSHVLPPIVDIHNRNGISLWQKVPQCVYKPAVKESKRRKKISSQESSKEVDALNKIANDLENLSLISKLIQLDDISLNHRDVKSVMSLSLTEDMRPYSHIDSVSTNIADWLTREMIHKKENTEQCSTKNLSSLLRRRKTNSGINSALSTIASTNDQRILSEDYLPSIRTICRAEEARNSSNNKRGNRFFHYLNGTKLPSNSSNILAASCKHFQEKSESVA